MHSIKSAHVRTLSAFAAIHIGEEEETKTAEMGEWLGKQRVMKLKVLNDNVL